MTLLMRDGCLLKMFCLLVPRVHADLCLMKRTAQGTLKCNEGRDFLKGRYYFQGTGYMPR